MPIAITRAISSALGGCELTHQQRVTIDLERARSQHRAYEQVLRDEGYLVEQLVAGEDLPDCVFVEDVAIVFDECAVITRPGAESRRPEVPVVANALGRYRSLERIQQPGTLDGGDVLVVGRAVFVGRSSRTNRDAILQLQRILRPHGYTVHEVTVRGCLHLKSAVTKVADGVALFDPKWVDSNAFPGVELMAIDPREHGAANALRLAECVVYPAAFPRTGELLARHGLRVRVVDASEIAKAEGAVTCCCLIVESPHE
jgi:dimethylargininase